MRELPTYNGATRQSAQQQFVRVQAPHVEAMGSMVDGALEQLGGVADKVIALHDFGVQQAVEAKMRVNDIEAEKDFIRRSELPWGDEESFYLSDGRVNDDVVRRYIGEQQQRNAQVEGNFWGEQARLEHAARLSDVNGRLERKVSLGLAAQESANRKRAFEANYELAVERGDLPGALRVLDDAQRAGQLLPAEVAKRKLELQRRQLQEVGALGGSVVVNGGEFSGASAGLAVARAKEGGNGAGARAVDAADGVFGVSVEDVLLREEDGVRLESEGLGTLGADGEVPVLEQVGGAVESQLTLNERDLGRVSRFDLERFGADGEAGGLSEEARRWTLLPEREVREFFDAVDDSLCVRQVFGADGGIAFFCQSYAPEVVQRVVARANVAGELTAEDAGEMVTRVAMDAVHADGGVTADGVVRVFDGAGVYEALGDGDAEVGKLRATALVRDVVERMQHGTNKLGLEAIERMVAARVDEVYRASGRDVGRLNPRRKKEDGVYEAWDARDTDKRWHELKHLYLGLRQQFNPGLEDGLSHEKLMKEFEGNAQEFYEWYAKGIGKERNDEYRAALVDWYMGQVSMKLADAYVGGGRYADGSGGFAADVGIAREVLRLSPPEVLNADVLAKQREEQQRSAEKRSAGMRRAAAQQYARLHGLKEERSMKRQREEKAKKAAEAKAAREEEKRLKEEEKKAQQLEQRRLAVKRAQPRRAEWEWDGLQAADGEALACSLPRAEWEALVEELGYDGSTNVYVVLGGKRVLVTGFHEGGAVRLNTPAAMVLQKKKEALRTRGVLGFSYFFK